MRHLKTGNALGYQWRRITQTKCTDLLQIELPSPPSPTRDLVLRQPDEDVSKKYQAMRSLPTLCIINFQTQGTRAPSHVFKRFENWTAPIANKNKNKKPANLLTNGFDVSKINRKTACDKNMIKSPDTFSSTIRFMMFARRHHNYLQQRPAIHPPPRHMCAGQRNYYSPFHCEGVRHFRNGPILRIQLVPGEFGIGSAEPIRVQLRYCIVGPRTTAWYRLVDRLDIGQQLLGRFVTFRFQLTTTIQTACGLTKWTAISLYRNGKKSFKSRSEKKLLYVYNLMSKTCFFQL